MRELSLFTGAGGGILGTHLLGWTPIGYVEWDDYCQRVLAARIADGLIPSAPIFGDVREFVQSGAAEQYRGFADVVSAGFPCQPFSNQVACYQQRARVRRIDESASGLRPRFLPTPMAGNKKWSGTWQEGGGSKNCLRNTTLATQKIHPHQWQWMMGLPIGWTCLEPLGRPRFQEWLQQHGSY
jgi:hypothetical protein